MDCIDFQKNIGSYLSDDLDDRNLNDFVNHLSGCKKCHEELEIEFIITKGPEIIDDPAGNYDLPASFSKTVSSSVRYLRSRKQFLVFRYILDTLVFWAVLFSAARAFLPHIM